MDYSFRWIVYSYLIFIVIFPSSAFSQKEDKDSEESFMDKVQQIIGIRRSFDVSSETTKPGVLSYKQNDDSDPIFNIDIALMYKGFRYDEWGFTPSVQFDYSSKPKDQLEKFKGGFDVFWKIIQHKNNFAKLEPAVSFTRDFYNYITEFQTSLSFIPRYPDFIIPLRNVSDIKFLYDGSDNRWVFGFNPIIGTNFKKIYYTQTGINQSDYFASIAGSFSIKRYYMLFELYGRYEAPVDKDIRSRYRYDATAVFFFDDKERSSLVLELDQKDLGDDRSRKISIGFGIKL